MIRVVAIERTMLIVCHCIVCRYCLDSMASWFHDLLAMPRNAISVSTDTILVQDGEPISTTVENCIVLMSIRAGAYFKLNRVGSQIWNMLVEPRRVGDIFEALAQTHDVDQVSMTHEVTEFLDALLNRRLVRVVKAAEAR